MIRTWMRYLGCIFLDRENARNAMGSLREGTELLKKGYSITIFPEGTRSRGDQMGDFKNGAFKMAEKAKVPLIPVRISGTYKVMEANHMWIKPANVTLTVLPPIPTAGLSREELKELGPAIREKSHRSAKSLIFTQKSAHGTKRSMGAFHTRFSQKSWQRWTASTRQTPWQSDRKSR